MVAKKRVSLRSKIAAKANRASASTPNQQVTDLPEDPKAFLHEFKETKRGKQLNKSEQFLTRLASKESNQGISKSSVRRRKRKQRDELKPKMQDLLTSLEDTTQDPVKDKALKEERLQNINIVKRPDFIEQKTTKSKNLPNPKNKKGSKQIESVERQHFSNVLKDSHFKQSPFEALKASIANRLKNDI